MRFESVALSQSLITPQIGQVVGWSDGPTANTQINAPTSGTNGANVIAFTSTLVAGQHYVMFARYQGTIGGSGTLPAFVNASITDSQGYLSPTPNYVMTVSGAAFNFGNVVQGSTFTHFIAAASGNDTFTFNVQCGPSPSAVWLFTNAGWCELFILRVQ